MSAASIDGLPTNSSQYGVTIGNRGGASHIGSACFRRRRRVPAATECCKVVADVRQRLNECVRTGDIHALRTYCTLQPAVARYFATRDCTDSTYRAVQCALETTFDVRDVDTCAPMLHAFGARYVAQFLHSACHAAVCDYLRANIVSALCEHVHDVWMPPSDGSDDDVTLLLVRHRTAGDAGFFAKIFGVLAALGYCTMTRTRGRHEAPTAHVEPIGAHTTAALREQRCTCLLVASRSPHDADDDDDDDSPIETIELRVCDEQCATLRRQYAELAVDAALHERRRQRHQQQQRQQ